MVFKNLINKIEKDNINLKSNKDWVILKDLLNQIDENNKLSNLVGSIIQYKNCLNMYK